jgi:hypothetical protein
MVAYNAYRAILPRNLSISEAEAERRRRGSFCFLPPQVFPSEWLDRATVNYEYWRSQRDANRSQQEERTVQTKSAASTSSPAVTNSSP